MPVKRVVASRDRDERRRTRAEIGRLQHRMVQPATLRKYHQAVAAFSSWLRRRQLRQASTVEELDFQVAEWMEEMWLAGEPQGTVGHALSGIQFLLRRKRILPASWNLLKVWQRVELPSRVPPLPEHLVTAMAGLARAWGRADVAALLVLGYAGFLRTTEMLTLRKWQLQFARDALVIILPLTKSGIRRNQQ